jgi:nucleotide-binding universal stress UspA family protein
MQVKTILVPFDFSEYADRALSWAVGLAKDGDAKILLLHVTPPIPAVATATALSFGALATEQGKRLMW